MRALLYPSALKGQVAAPPSKSAAHRALICAALAGGESRIHGVLPSADMEATLRAVTALGARVSLAGETALVTGCGGVLRAAGTPVDCGESGSTLRFLLPLFALSSTPARLTGRGRLPQRPLEPYAAVFQGRGLAFAQDAGGVSFCGPLEAGVYELPGDVSSQFVSGLLFALPLLQGPSEIRIRPPFESRPYVDMTLDALAAFGVTAAFTGGLTLAVPGAQAYRARPYQVEGDASQAAFFLTLGAVLGGVTVTGLNPATRQGDRAMADILARCGASPGQKRPLRATQVDLADCPDLGPILMALGLFCQGETLLYNAGRLRLKESDRAAAMQEELAKLGGRVRLEGDRVYIQGGPLHEGPPLSSHGDHRVAMALAVAALCAGVPAAIDGAEAVNKSFPGFFGALQALGARVEYGM